MAPLKDEASKTLSFFGQALKLNDEVDARPVAEKIEAFDGLETLCMQGCTVGPEAAKQIAKALESKSSLKRMQFQDMFTGRLKQEIPLCLRYFGSGMELAGAHLVELNLSDNAIGPVGAEGLVPILLSEVCYSLKELRLNNTGLGPTGSQMVAEALCECLDSSSRAGTPLGLTVFIAGRSRLESSGAKLFAQVFSRMGTLEEISVPQCGIFPDGIQALCDALLENPNMRHVNFEDNIIKADGAKGMAKALRQLELLEEINLGDGLLKTKGAQILGDALRETKSKLKNVNFSSNEITVEGGLALADGLLAHAETLEHVNLDLNAFGETGAEQIVTKLTLGGLGDALAPFEDNQEPDSEDEEKDEPEGEESGEEPDAEPAKMNGHAPQSSVSGKDFLLNPKLGDIQKMLGDPVAELTSAMNELFPEMDPVHREIELMARVCTVLRGIDDVTTPDGKKVVSVFKGLMERAFKRNSSGSGDAADDDKRFQAQVNHLMVVLGLIKHEDKKWKMEWEPEGILVALTQVVRESYFPGQLRSDLQFFLGRPSHLDKYHRVKHELLRNLF